MRKRRGGKSREEGGEDMASKGGTNETQHGSTENVSKGDRCELFFYSLFLKTRKHLMLMVWMGGDTETLKPVLPCELCFLNMLRWSWVESFASQLYALLILYCICCW